MEHGEEISVDRGARVSPELRRVARRIHRREGTSGKLAPKQRRTLTRFKSGRLRADLLSAQVLFEKPNDSFIHRGHTSTR